MNFAFDHGLLKKYAQDELIQAGRDTIRFAQTGANHTYSDFVVVPGIARLCNNADSREKRAIDGRYVFLMVTDRETVGVSVVEQLRAR
ncbi:MAG: hypothetical protein E6Q88_03995 [Lysobacteraceae bacterium]|nr:MAG: hypothetical protein E6Q88_03995 [Xanthomonadaceae bacterium]